MPKYKVKSPLSHDGEDFKIGATVEMSEKQAQPLLGHTLMLPGEELTEKQIGQAVLTIESEAHRLAEERSQLAEEQTALSQERAAFAAQKAAFEAGAKTAAKK